MPRPRENASYTGSAAGALIGSLLGGWGALAGGLLGTAANPRTPIPLDVALRNLFERNGLFIVTLVRLSPHGVLLTVGAPPANYGTMQIEVHPNPAWDLVRIEDELYEQAERNLEALG